MKYLDLALVALAMCSFTAVAGDNQIRRNSGQFQERRMELRQRKQELIFLRRDQKLQYKQIKKNIYDRKVSERGGSKR